MLVQKTIKRHTCLLRYQKSNENFYNMQEFTTESTATKNGPILSYLLVSPQYQFHCSLTNTSIGNKTLKELTFWPAEHKKVICILRLTSSWDLCPWIFQEYQGISFCKRGRQIQRLTEMAAGSTIQIGYFSGLHFPSSQLSIRIRSGTLHCHDQELIYQMATYLIIYKFIPMLNYSNAKLV